ncbi:MAG: hypothetical protein WB984_01875 [Thermoplasmata archaeon]
MSGVVCSTPALSTPVRWERLRDLSHRFLLPAVALTSLFLGLVLFLDPLASVGSTIPFALFAIGSGGLAGFISLHGWKTTVLSPATSVTAAGVATSSRPADPLGAVAPGPNERHRARLTPKGAEWRVLPAPSISRDGGWISWLPREHRRSGIEGVEPVPGVVHSPGRAGNLVWFPVRKDYHGVRSSPGSGDLSRPSPGAEPSLTATEAGGPSVPPVTSPRRGRDPSEPLPGTRPLSVEELDRMFPPVSSSRSTFLSEAPERVGGPSTWVRELSLPADPLASPDESTSSTEGRSSTFEEGEDPPSQADPFEGRRADHSAIPETTSSPRSHPPDGTSRSNAETAELFLEAANPVPPHLRGESAHARMEARRPSVRSIDPASQRSVCASCSKVVVNLRMSGPCPKCLRPICNDCLREAFVTHGHGWCIDCSAAATVGIG